MSANKAAQKRDTATPAAAAVAQESAPDSAAPPCDAAAAVAIDAAAASPAAAVSGAGPVSYDMAPDGSRDYADDMPRNLYAVIYPGRFLTAAIIEMGTDPEEKTVAGSILWTAYEASAYTERGIPDFARIRRFGSSLSGAVNDLCRSLSRNLTAVLVRTPPPAAVYTSATAGGAGGGSTEHLQCNTYFEGFAVGWLTGLYPHTPTWYCHPNAIRALFSGAGDDRLRTWSSREEESADIMAMAMDVVGKPLRHDREAGCVLAAVHHYIKFAKAGFAERPKSAEQALPPPPPLPAPAPACDTSHFNGWGKAPASRVKAAPSAGDLARLNAPIKQAEVYVKKFEEAKLADKARTEIARQGPKRAV